MLPKISGICLNCSEAPRTVQIQAWGILSHDISALDLEGAYRLPFFACEVDMFNC